MTALDLVRLANGHGVVVEAVRLTRDNGPAVWEWADSKPFYDPGQDGLVITGLTVFTPGGRVKAEFGDWVIRRPNATWDACPDADLAARYGTPICPACRCDPYRCATGDTGDHCEAQSCGSCLHGCPLDECPAHPEVRR